MSMWMSFLSHLVAVAICARILSATADHVTEGRTRRWLFGYETRSLGEPWPDVLGVTVVLVVCAMFMCGLEVIVQCRFAFVPRKEFFLGMKTGSLFMSAFCSCFQESIMFTFMLLMVLYIFSQFFAIFGLINLDIANIQLPIPITIFEVSLTTNGVLEILISA